MSVYTQLTKNQLNDFLNEYNIGEFDSLVGIASGITNTNYFLTTSCGKYVLTIFEVLKHNQLSFYLDLNLHLFQNGVACASPISLTNGHLFTSLAGKPACLMSLIDGQDVMMPNKLQCFNTGAMMAKMHLSCLNYPQNVKNPRYDEWWNKSSNLLSSYISHSDMSLLSTEINFLNRHFINIDLPFGVIHADLFKDNVLLNKNDVAGFIDFYYACSGTLIYDLAIAINDWARTENNTINEILKFEFVRGYESIRPLTNNEKKYLPVAQRAACIRFWVSRLLDYYFPQSGDITFVKNPDEFKELLTHLHEQI